MAILTDVWLYRYLTTKQIARVHFCGHVKLAQRRLRLLTARGLVDRFRPTQAAQAGFRTWWYRLARQGARIIAKEHALEVAETLPPRRPPRTMGFLAHHALTTEFRLWLREACTGAFGYQFLPSYDEVREQGRRQRRIALSVPGHQRLLIPDGAFTLEREGRRALFVLEVDRGTEPLTGKHPSAIEHKLRRYRAAFNTRAAEEHYGRLFQAAFAGFRVLCLVPDEQRQRGFLALAKKLDLVPLVWVATNELVGERGDLDARCWMVMPDSPPHRLTE